MAKDKTPAAPDVAPNAELDNLAGLAASIDASAAPAPADQAGQGTEETPEPSQADQLAGILLMLGQAGAMRFPSLGKVYSEEKCKAHAAAITPALDRLGVRLNAGETMVYLTAAGSVLMLLFETRSALITDLKAEKAEREAKGEAQPAAPAAAPAAPTSPGGTPIQLVHPQMGLYPK